MGVDGLISGRSVCFVSGSRVWSTGSGYAGGTRSRSGASKWACRPRVTKARAQSSFCSSTAFGRWEIYSTVQCRTVQYSTVQYSTVQYSTVQYSTVQYSTVQYSTVQYSTVQYSTVQYSTVQFYSTVQCSTVQFFSTVQLEISWIHILFKLLWWAFAGLSAVCLFIRIQREVLDHFGRACVLVWLRWVPCRARGFSRLSVATRELSRVLRRARRWTFAACEVAVGRKPNHGQTSNDLPQPVTKSIFFSRQHCKLHASTSTPPSSHLENRVLVPARQCIPGVDLFDAEECSTLNNACSTCPWVLEVLYE